MFHVKHMTDINDFLGIAIVGGVLSVIFEIIKKKLPNSPEFKRLAILVLSVAIGTGYWVLRGTQYYQTVIGILAAASTVYALFLKEEKPQTA